MSKRFFRRCSQWLVAALLVTSLPQFAMATSGDVQPAGGEPVTLAASGAVTLVSEDGATQLAVQHVNINVDAPPQKSNYISLFTSGAGVSNTDNVNEIFVKQGNLALEVNGDGQIAKVHGPSPELGGNGKPVSFEASHRVTIPEGGYVVLASDADWTTSQYRKPVYEHFKTGDVMTLMRDGAEVTAEDFLNVQPGLALTSPAADAETVTVPVYELKGTVLHYKANDGLRVTVNDADVPLSGTGAFALTLSLVQGANEAAVKLWREQTELAAKTVVITYDNSGQVGDYIEVEAAPIDITISLEGPRKQLTVMDVPPAEAGVTDFVGLYTRNYGTSLTVPMTSVAVQVGPDGKVTRVVNPSIGGNPPVWTGPTELDIPAGGYVLYAQDSSYANNMIKRYLATYFEVGDAIKLRKNGNVVSLTELMGDNGLLVRLSLDNYDMYTVTDDSTAITGKLSNLEQGAETVLTVNEAEVPYAADGSFSYELALEEGINYAKVTVTKNGILQKEENLVIYARPGFAGEKQVILWVDQASNAKKFQTSDNVYQFLKKAKDSGITDIAFDVKGVEGFVSYKKATLTDRPYVSEITAPGKAGASPNLDLLQEFVEHGHALGLKVHAAINDFAEGSIASGEYAVLDDHLDWEERVYKHQDGGVIKRLRESSAQGLVAFVNPANDDVRAFQMDTYREVIENYDVDGVIHDRGRYDNETADFSDVTRAKFEAYLADRGKTLTQWPQDVFRYEGTTRVDGPLINEWWAFRASVITSYFDEVKDMVDAFETESGRTIEVSSYVGSWFETYYLNGVHWGSPNFRYDERLGLGNPQVYTDDYYENGYIEHIDFLMIGAYQETGPEVEKYITLGNIVTNGEIPLYAGIAMNNVQQPEKQREIFQSGLRNSNGLMLFDASQVNWPVVAASLQDKVYVKDYQLGLSLPGQPEQFLEADYLDINLVEGDINVYSESYGATTGGGRYNVEVVVDADGVVTKMPNRTQAVNWSWGTTDDTNSAIPAGGFVISTLDPSGTRTNRQLVANAYQIGDIAKAAVLRGYMQYEGMQTTSAQVELRGQAEVIGNGEAEVIVNGVKLAALSDEGLFSTTVPLALGANTVTIEVFVDGYKTNEKSVVMTRNAGGGGSTGGSYTPPQPERVKLEWETGADGERTAVLQVNKESMLKELSQLKGKPASDQVLGYMVSADDFEEASGVKAVLPVEGMLQALNDIPSGMIELVTPVGTFRLSVRGWAEALEDAEAGSELVIGLGAAELSSDASELLAEQGGRLSGEHVLELQLELVSADGQTTEAVEGFIAQLILHAGQERSVSVASSGGSSARLTAILLDAETGEPGFVPARFVKDEDDVLAELRISGNGAYGLAVIEKSFADLQGHWAEEDVTLLASKLLVEGSPEGLYHPEAEVSRAEFAALLTRALGLRSVDVDDAPSFSDVSPGDWFADEVAAAAEAGLILGFENGEFRPDAAITREEMSVMLLRALQAAGKDTVSMIEEAAGLNEALGIADWAYVSDWAIDAVAVSMDSKLMNGRTDGRFDPQALASRAEAAVVLKRLLQYVEYID
nr:S-layer homology domain-containing protein [Paenibacillus soyae]